jgi:hypothetical protein
MVLQRELYWFSWCPFIYVFKASSKRWGAGILWALGSPSQKGVWRMLEAIWGHLYVYSHLLGATAGKTDAIPIRRWRETCGIPTTATAAWGRASTGVTNQQCALAEGGAYGERLAAQMCVRERERAAQISVFLCLCFVEGGRWRGGLRLAWWARMELWAWLVGMELLGRMSWKLILSLLNLYVYSIDLSSVYVSPRRVPNASKRLEGGPMPRIALSP